LQVPTIVRETLACGQWLNMDGKLAVRCFNGTLLLNRPDRPQITIKKPAAALTERSGGQNYAEEICAGACFERGFPRMYEKGDVLFDIACAVRVGIDASETAAWCKEQPQCEIQCGKPEALRQAVVRGVDGCVYAVCFNIDEEPLEVSVNGQNAKLEPGASHIFKC
ncbi:MAG: hypothetical protein IJS08_05665, partial [Victivallales bacterium]|nr:hypothetical protein [Victivallales bacterium]